MYCGFCEPVCPTLQGIHRGYGPRGRVNLALMLARDGYSSKLVEESLYTCLLCGACMEVCPARIDIVGVVRASRTVMSVKQNL
ncbi:MAG: (Fe-S)-binding protein [Desulfurococcales archaeon]|nr:(Fe-S)-binding protein [Desulfurococcales archaeon]